MLPDFSINIVPDFRKEYYFSKVKATWQDSQRFCEQLWLPVGGKLVQIYYQHENVWLKDNINESVWLGMSSENKEQLQWRDGCPLKYTANQLFQNNDVNVNKAALFIRPNGSWSLTNANDSQLFMCEV